MRVAVAGGTGAVGYHVTEALKRAGHDVTVLARSTGIDLVDPVGLRDALGGVQAVVDVTSTTATSSRASIRFFEAVTRNLLAAEQDEGVSHHVALSIVGALEAPFGYYAGKARQEELVKRGGVQWTLLRTTQFYEFVQQLVDRSRLGRIVIAPTMECQPIDAARVGKALAEIAIGAPLGVARSLAGPRRARMPDLVRQYLQATDRNFTTVGLPVPGRWGSALRDGTLLPDTNAYRDDTTFEDWLVRITSKS